MSKWSSFKAGFDKGLYVGALTLGLIIGGGFFLVLLGILLIHLVTEELLSVCVFVGVLVVSGIIGGLIGMDRRPR